MRGGSQNLVGAQRGGISSRLGLIRSHGLSGSAPTSKSVQPPAQESAARSHIIQSDFELFFTRGRSLGGKLGQVTMLELNRHLAGGSKPVMDLELGGALTNGMANTIRPLPVGFAHLELQMC